MEGSADHLRVTEDGVVAWDGPLAGLDPIPPPAPTGSPVHVRALTQAARAGVLDCEAHAVRVGAWPEPVAVPPGAEVVRHATSDVLLRGERTVHLVALPADRDLAASLALETDAVAWRGGVALAARGGPLPDAVTPAGERLGLAPWLGLERPPATVPAVAAPWREGAELAGMVDEVRDGLGLGPIAWDQGLADAALQHAAYLVLHRGEVETHREDPDDPLFAGEQPEQRGGARELLLHLPHARAGEALEAWLTAPYHRMPLLHPGARAIGVARVGATWVAEVRVDGAVRPTGGWPTDGVVVPTGRFEGHEQPDPLPSSTFPDVRWPVGFPVTVWGAPVKLKATFACDGASLPFRVADAALGTPREAVHLIPVSPLAAGASCAWTASWTESADGVATAREARGGFAVRSGDDGAVPIAAAVAPVLADANARRSALGLPPLVPTAEARARARLLSARTRAMTEGLAPSRVPGLSGGDPGDPHPLVVCTRPDDPLEVDESWLDPRARAVGADDTAVVVTWSRGPDGPVARLAAPRLCVWIFGER